MIIYKYELEPLYTIIELPTDYKILHIALQNNKPYVWILLNPGKAITIKLKLSSIYTGELFPTSENMKYIGTYQLDGEVCHIFEHSLESGV